MDICQIHKWRCQVGIWTYEFTIQGRGLGGAINMGILTLYIIIWRKKEKVQALNMGHTNI